MERATSHFDFHIREIDTTDWSTTLLGRRSQWNSFLSAYVNLIATLPHPAAVYWGSELRLVSNIAWSGALKGEQGQGSAAEDYLSDGEGLSALRSSLKGHTVEVAGKFLMHRSDSPILLSPLLDHNGSQHGVLAQSLHQTHATGPRDRVQALGDSEASERLSRDDEKHDVDNLTKLDLPAGSDDEFRGLQGVKLKENKWFRLFAQMLPTGLAILDEKAEALFVNDNFYKLTSRTSSKTYRAWPESIHPDDHEKIMSAYEDAIEAKRELHIEFRCAEDETDESHNVPWRVLLMRPLHHQSKKSGFLCAVVDISEIKAAERAQREKAIEAQERRKQQESFIDMVSHEIRNPLSAIFGSIGEISEAAEKLSVRLNLYRDEEIDGIKEATETIMLCASHQNSLVDDILAFSKLSADMLTLAPHAVQPSVVFAKSCRLFTSELKSKDIKLEYVLDPSYSEHKIDFVMADEHRLRQVLLNLMSNAIKFIQRKDGERKISIAMGASLQRPKSCPPDIVFYEDETPGRPDATSTEEWGTGDVAYFLVAVKDTGIGMNELEQKELFRKFHQATPRTQEKYGGTGLGLFISRKLCQLHGGDIGVASEHGKGTTFGFFFKAKRTGPPTSEDTSTTNVIGQMPHNRSMPGRPRPGDKANDQEHGTKDQPVALEAYKHSTQVAEPENTSEVKSFTSILPHDPDRTWLFLVEDNEINAKVLSRQLTSKGFSIMTAHNGDEAVAMFQRLSNDIEKHAKLHEGDPDCPPPRNFDCILMDQEMPMKDGITATREIRELGYQIPILGVSANARQEQIQDMKDAGMNDVISKPFKVPDVVSKVHQLLERNGC